MAHRPCVSSSMLRILIDTSPLNWHVVEYRYKRRILMIMHMRLHYMVGWLFSAVRHCEERKLYLFRWREKNRCPCSYGRLLMLRKAQCLLTTLHDRPIFIPVFEYLEDYLVDATIPKILALGVNMSIKDLNAFICVCHTDSSEICLVGLS